MNAGAGHHLEGNVFVAGRFGALNRASGSQKTYRTQQSIAGDPDHPHRFSKEDYVGRAERITGPNGWSKPPWSERYPLMNAIMSKSGEHGRLWPIGCTVLDNVYAANTGRNATFWDRFDRESQAQSTFGPEHELTLSDFRDVAALDFRAADDFSDRAARAVLERIPFEDIGLRLDEHRSVMPEKVHYRAAMRRVFDGIGSMPGTHVQCDSAAIVLNGPMVKREQP